MRDEIIFFCCCFTMNKFPIQVISIVAFNRVEILKTSDFNIVFFLTKIIILRDKSRHFVGVGGKLWRIFRESLNTIGVMRSSMVVWRSHFVGSLQATFVHPNPTGARRYTLDTTCKCKMLQYEERIKRQIQIY